MNNKGFSLAELLAVLAILIIVVALVSGDLIGTIRYWVSVNALTEVEQYLRYSMQTIAEDIRNATEIDVNGSELVNRVNLQDDAIVIVDDTSITYSIENNELFRNNNSLGGPFTEVSIRRVNRYRFGSLYEIYVTTQELDFERVPGLNMRQYIFAPNAKP
jgi:type II secretory pathway pseudopilin PulG